MPFSTLLPLDCSFGGWTSSRCLEPGTKSCTWRMVWNWYWKRLNFLGLWNCHTKPLCYLGFAYDREIHFCLVWANAMLGFLSLVVNVIVTQIPSPAVFTCGCSVVSDVLQLCGLQHARFPCPSLSPGVCSNSCPLSQWCYLTISSSVAPFSCCSQFFPGSGSFPVSRIFLSGGQSIRASASVLPVII